MTITACINYKIHNFGFDMQVGQFEGSSGQLSGNTQKPSCNEFFVVHMWSKTQPKWGEIYKIYFTL